MIDGNNNLPKRVTEFLSENFPADESLAGYVICIAKRDKTIVVAQGYDNAEVRDKVQKALNRHMDIWEVQ